VTWNFSKNTIIYYCQDLLQTSNTYFNVCFFHTVDLIRTLLQFYVVRRFSSCFQNFLLVPFIDIVKTCISHKRTLCQLPSFFSVALALLVSQCCRGRAAPYASENQSLRLPRCSWQIREIALNFVTRILRVINSVTCKRAYIAW
jgi:hypothetical protein